MISVDHIPEKEVSNSSLLYTILKQYKWSLFARLVLCTAGTIFLALLPRLVGNLVGSLSVSHVASTYAIIKLVSANVLLTTIWCIDDLISARYKPLMRKHILDTLGARILYQNKRYFTDHNSGKLVAALQDIGHAIFTMIECVFTALVVAGSVTLYVYECYNSHMYIGMLMTVWAIVWSLTVYYSTVKGLLYSKVFTAKNIDLSSHAANVIDNIVSVQSACNEKHESELIQQCSNNTADAEFKMEVVNTIGITAQHTTIVAVDAIVYIIACKMYFDGIIAVRDIVQFGIVIGIIINITRYAAKQIRYFIESSGRYAACIAILGQTLDAQSSIQEAVDSHGIDGDIEIKRLTFTHQNLETEDGLFKNISLTIKKGETIGFVGQSGSGKTTLINLLMGHYNKRYSGSISIGGVDIQSISIQQLRKCFAYVPQKITMFRRSVHDNIAYRCADMSRDNVINAAKHARADRFIQQLPDQYDTTLNIDGIELSGGQQQRIMLARAMAQLETASILIIDEGTSALDTETEKEIEQALHSVLTQTDKTCIIIAHRLSTLRRADKIVVFDNGRIVEIGSHDELLSNENSTYKKLWQAQLV